MGKTAERFLINMNEKISVIIPCYNVEQYVEKCIDSVLNQSYRNLEIILVDDASSDNTGNILDKYSESDNRVKVVHHDVNKGLSEARNTGIRYATAKYLSFVDGDDRIYKKTYAYLWKLLVSTGADCSVGRMRVVYLNAEKNKAEYITRVPDELVSSTEAMRKELINGGGVNNRIYKRELFDDILFPVGKTNEDEEVILKVYSRCKKVIMGGRMTYEYRKRENSITTSQFSAKNLDFYFNTLKHIDFVREERPELLEYAYARHYNAAAYGAAMVHLHMRNEEGRKYLRIIKKDLKENRKKILTNKHLPLKYKVVGFICSFI